jgi:hypothetical protein
VIRRHDTRFVFSRFVALMLRLAIACSVFWSVYKILLTGVAGLARTFRGLRTLKPDWAMEE